MTDSCRNKESAFAAPIKWYYWVLISCLGIACSESKLPDEPTLFTKLNATQTGITFSNDLTETPLVNVILYEYFYNGGGVAAGDINNDGLTDLYFTGNQVSNKLYLNKGNFTFEDITSTAKVAGTGVWSNGVTMADVNGDGLLDIYVCNSGKNAGKDQRRNELFINNGDLTFMEKANEFGIDDPAYSTQSIFLDIDRDNDLDLFLLNRPIRTFKAEEALAFKNEVNELAGDKLFRNDNGKFIDVSAGSGINRNGLGYGLGVTAGDLNKDGWPDLYVANDYIEPDYLYINNGDWTFSENGKQATKHMSNFSMGVDIADVNNDLWPDIFVADMAPIDNYRQKTMMKPMSPEQFYRAVSYGFHHQYMFNTLQLNNQDLTFSEAAQLAGVATTDWSWSTLFADFDNDQWNDLLITNGFRKEFSNKDFIKTTDKKMNQAMEKSLDERMELMKSLLEDLPETKLQNFIYQNTGDLSYIDKSNDWGLTSKSFSNGATVADLDNDGDLDLIINNIDEGAFVYQNNLDSENSVRLKLNGPAKNSSGIGAKLTLFAGESTQYKEHFLTKGYQSSVEDFVHFGLGDKQADSLNIIWPDGKSQTLTTLQKIQEINYSDAKIEVSKEEISSTLFANVTREVNLDHTHIENQHNDFLLEVLLPHKMSQFGPALAIGDFNTDGLEDFFTGGATGQAGKLFLQQADGSFQESFQGVFRRDAFFEDVGAQFLDVDGDDDLDLYVASGGNEWFPNSPFYQDRLYLNIDGNLAKANLPEMKTSNAVIRPFDLDQDGDLDLFVGSRLNPVQYPTPGKSWILVNEDGAFVDQTEAYNSSFKRLGLVSDAKWSDLNGDTKPELVIVGEWSTIRVFELSDQKLSEVTDQYGLQNYVGWWNSVELDDINKDGLPDIIAGNLGLNYKYKASPEEPFHIYYNDFDGNGRGDIVLGYYNEGELFPLRGRQCSSEQMPSLASKFKTYDEFGKATLDDVYGKQKLEQSVHYEATTFASTVFLSSSKNTFEPKELPRMAQLSSINSFVVEDFNKDGNLDLLFAGNHYPVEIETTRNDASYGGLLIGDGKGNFEFKGQVETGFIADGDIKHLATIQLAGASSGILVARNSGKIELFKKNEYGK